MAAAASSCASTVSSSSTSDDIEPTPLYKFKVTLITDYHRPRGGRWRRIVVPANFSLLEFHVVLQVVFGWENSHLHHFMRNRLKRNHHMPLVEYIIKNEHGNDDFMSEETREERIYKLSDVFSVENPTMEYEYDFGACWGHEVKFEGAVDADPKLDYPACIQGKWANRMDDHQDEDPDTSELLPEYEGKQFDLNQTQKELRDVFEGKWPLKVNNATIPKCYLCCYYFCSKCNGKCCKYCLKADIVRNKDAIEQKKKAEADMENRVRGYLNKFFNWQG